jgi:DNA-binding NarL/FixJ family response regulator
MNTVSILVADDHPIVRRGMRALLEGNAGWKVVAEACNGREAVVKAGQLRPDLAILDVSMPLLNGLEAARQITKYAPKTRVLVFSVYDTPELVQKTIHSGAWGFVRKSEAETELVSAVHAVLNDKLFFPSMASEALRRALGRGTTVRQTHLTAREAEILQLVAEGKSNREAASILGISLRTVENHRARIKKKLGVRSLSDLVRYAVRNKIVAA